MMRPTNIALVTALALVACRDEAAPSAATLTGSASLDAGSAAAPSGGSPAAAAPAAPGPLGPAAASPEGSGSAAPATSAAGRTTPAPPVDCPADMAPTGLGGCIDRWEASAGPGELGAPSGEGTTLSALSKPGKPPLVEVSLHQAARACENAKKALCTADEWLEACRGPEGLTYGYGSEYQPRRCRDWKASGSGREKASPTGSYPGCKTASGIYDMNNNVGEWTQDAERTGLFVVRGGTFNTAFHDSRCAKSEYVVPASARQGDLGFRCCAPARGGKANR